MASPESPHAVNAVVPIRLLIVDDRAPAREGLKALLSVMGEAKGVDRLSIQVVGEACDGLQALLLVEELSPDIVLMDVRMPGINGIEVTRLIKSSKPDVLIILMSFYGVHRTDALEAGSDAFILKGCPSKELFKVILSIVSSAQSRKIKKETAGLTGGMKVRGGKQDG